MIDAIYLETDRLRDVLASLMEERPDRYLSSVALTMDAKEEPAVAITFASISDSEWRAEFLVRPTIQPEPTEGGF